MAVYIFAARIYLDSDPTVANASDIGLYDDADNGSNQVFRWIESDISVYSPTYTWKTGIFTPEPIDDIVESVDLELGGNLPSIGGTNVRIGNTLPIGGTMTQFDKTVESAGIRFNGLRCDIIRFEVSSGALVSADGDIVFRGICGDPKWTEREYAIPVENSGFKREANLSTVITTDNYPNATGEILGSVVPVTFGEFKPEYDANNKVLWNGYAEFKRTANSQEVVKITTLYPTGNIIAGDELSVYMLEYGDIPASKRNRSIFPIVGDSGAKAPLTYRIDIGSETPFWIFPVRLIAATTGKYRIPNFESKYLYVIEANGNTSSMKGKYRRIDKAWVDLDVDKSIIYITINNCFETTLEGNATANSTNQCWVQIVGINRNYTSDIWPCKGYLDEDGNAINSALSLYSYNQPKKAKVTTENTDAIIEEGELSFYRLPEYAFLNRLVSYNNEMIIDVKLFDSTPDQMNSFLILPLENIELMTSTTELTELGVKNSPWIFRSPGVFVGINYVTLSIDINSSYVNNLTDRKYKTSGRAVISSTGSPTRVLIAVKFTYPDYPKFFGHDSIYFGIRLRFNYALAAGTPVISEDMNIYNTWVRFLGDSTKTFDHELRAVYENLSGVNTIGKAEDILDQYYLDNYNNNNRWFYYDSAVTTLFSGYTNYEITDIDTEEKYNSVERSALFMELDVGNGDKFVIDNHQVAMMFRKSVSIESAIYTPFKGRIYKSTWGSSEGTSSYSSSSSSESSSSSSSSSISLPSSSSSSSQSSSSSSQSSPSSSSSSSTSCTYGNARKNGCAMIDNPVDILEHAMRLQNWSEQGETKEWGKEYANNPLIDVSTSEGGFDYEDLDYLKTLRPARQIKEFGEASTSEIAQSLCKQFFIVSYQNPLTGKESVSYMADRSLTSPTTTITLSDIIGPIGEIIYPEVRNIYPEITIKYAQNPANGVFEKTIQVTNTNAATFDSSYVVGISGSTAELMWQRGKVLWEATRNIEPLPKDRSELTWYVKDADAIWYMETLYSWMGAINTDGTPSGVVFDPKKRTSFSVPYETGKAWFLTQHHNLQLSHQTNNQAIEFAIEEISKNIKKGQEKVTVSVILYGDTSELEYYVKDTMEAGVLLDDWKDSVDTQAEEPTQEEDIQDSM